MKPSRTMSVARSGLAALMGLAAVVLLVLLGEVLVPDLDPGPYLASIESIAYAVAAVATGGAVGLSARHFGAKEQSSFKETPCDPSS